MEQSFSQILEGNIIPFLQDATGYTVERMDTSNARGATTDARLSMGTDHRQVQLLVAYKTNRSLLAIATAADNLKQEAQNSPRRAYPLLVVTYMSEMGRNICREEHVNWIDLCGNAYLKIPPIAIQIEGKPNKFPARGKPPNVFRGKSQRLIRALLASADQPLRHGELVARTKLDKAQVSRLLQQLMADGSVARDEDSFRVTERDRLLAAWRTAYDFSAHELLQGHIPGATPEKRLDALKNALGTRGIRHAFSGLSAAQAYTRMFMTYGVITVYVDRMPEKEILDELLFVPEPRGSNLWLVVPEDPAMMNTLREVDGLPMVSPIQTYLDLKAHPEGAETVAHNVLYEIEREWQG